MRFLRDKRPAPYRRAEALKPETPMLRGLLIAIRQLDQLRFRPCPAINVIPTGSMPPRE